jgi:hypothetical protein
MTLEAIAGRLRLDPGRSPAVACERPVVGAALLGRLTRGRAAALVPDLLASVFTLCADAQRGTSRRAVQAALGRTGTACDAAGDAQRAALQVAREHLQRLALDLPARSATAAPQPGWLREVPLHGLESAPQQALPQAAAALRAFLEAQLLGMPATAWLDAWRRGRGDWLARWCRQQPHPVARWLAAVQPDAEAAGWDCRALHPDAPDAAASIAAALERDARFAASPIWQGAPAETGPWTRGGSPDPVFSAWDRLGARIADLSRIALGQPLACGALTLAEGVGLAWTEMSRGLLMHWVQLEGARQAETARVVRYHVLAPTEWNFHADGAFARWLAAGSATAAQARLAAAALDPCIEFSLDEAGHHA